VKNGLLKTAFAAAASGLFPNRRRRVMASEGPAEHRTVDAAQVADYAGMSATTYRVCTARDVLPGGWSAAMAPVFVVWDRSSFAPGQSVTIRNLNHGGNPIGGITVLRTAVLRPDKLERVEYVRVPLGGPDAISHGQLRFVFEPGGIELVGGDPSVVGEPDAPADLVLSWEAWRPPGTNYSILKGMDPAVYRLSLRAYSGVQRFLEDALQNRNWESYPLALPGGREGIAELLKVSLTMGDGAARCVMSELLEGTNDEWVAAGPRDEPHGNAAALWRDVQSRLGDAAVPSDERLDLAGLTGYHSVLRSCASMVLYEIHVTTARLVERGHGHDGLRPMQIAEITEIPDWMMELAGASVAGLFLRGPRMIAFVRKYPSAIPGNIPKQLDEAGLLVREDGKPVSTEFNICGETPWGPASQLLLR